MIHLTHTGHWSGKPFCDTDKPSTLIRPGDTFAHANYKALTKPTYRSQVCPTCLAAWDQAREDLNDIGIEP